MAYANAPAHPDFTNIDNLCMDRIQSLYMSTTVNISLPKQMYDDAKRFLKQRRYASLSELIREALRGVLYPNLTENGFTPEFEAEVLKAAAEPEENDKVWETEKEIKNYFKDLDRRIKKKHGKDQAAR